MSAPGTARPDLAVTGRRVVTPDGVRPATVLVGGGRILAVGPPAPAPPGVPVVDAGDRYVLPGLVDGHVHFRTPGLTHKEDWAHAGRAAVAGGVTTVADMPNTVPPALTGEVLEAKAALVAGRSLVDHVLHVGVDPADPDRLRDLAPGMRRTAKMFLAGHHTAPTVFRDAGQTEKAFAVAADLGVQLVLHAEDSAVFDLLDHWRGDPVGYLDYERRRPRSGAIVAVAKVVELVRRHGTRAHLLHVSSTEEADLACAAAAAGLPVTFEVTGHHLSFTDGDGARLGARIRLSPSIRGAADRDRLWDAVFADEVTVLGSDHAPHSVQEKVGPVAAAPPGLPGVQELAVTTWTGMRRRRPEEDPDVAVSRLVRLLADRPAALLGLPGKGRIAAGSDADLVLFDPDVTWMGSAADVHSLCGWSAYEGWTLTGRVVRTLRAGRTVYASDAPGSWAFGEPDGRWLR